ncbi:MAG: pentapeptide repeat-containing protein [Gammaproteobacteria bacterium]|nr:pentapeptide repeat-containing protein [Gammaproteobacteria bacterium]
MTELIEHETFASDRSAFQYSDHGVYRFCMFESFAADGPHVGATYIDCAFSSVDMYWAFFNCAILVSCTFEDCVFRGASFAGCRIIDCRFVRCRFIADSVGGSCTSSDTRWYGCAVTECEGWDELQKE